VASLQGRAREAYLLLDLQLRAAGADVTPEIAGWSHAVLGGIAERLGRREDAARAYRAALAANPSDRFARVSLADLLLFDQHRSAEALRVVHDAPAVDEALALREAIARRALQDPRWREIASTLQARFDVARRRGESLHLREEALYWRELRQDPVRALDTARRNWSVQREPADARLLLDCARAVGDAATEAQARSWYRATGSALPRGDGENVTVVDPAPAQEGRP
jgi:tetratricopeptide (TPR) repeat protein